MQNIIKPHLQVDKSKKGHLPKEIQGLPTKIRRANSQLFTQDINSIYGN
jgi:hypothetical protein